MFSQDEIEEMFKALNLKGEEERQAILSQGLLPEPESTREYDVVLDNATTVNEEGGPQDTRLE